MAKQIPRSSVELTRLLQRAMARPDRSQQINEEYLAQLCLGRIDEIPAEVRSHLLDAIAADPESAELVAELRQLGWGGDVRIGDAAIFTLRLSSWAWAAAACLALALGVWRLAAPPANPANPPTYVQTIPQPENPANASAPRPQPSPAPQVNPQPAAPAPAFAARDAALLAAIVLAALLSVPTAYYIRARRLMRRIQFD
jgi:hypothetical protein